MWMENLQRDANDGEKVSSTHEGKTFSYFHIVFTPSLSSYSSSSSTSKKIISFAPHCWAGCWMIKKNCSFTFRLRRLGDILLRLPTCHELNRAASECVERHAGQGHDAHRVKLEDFIPHSEKYEVNFAQQNLSSPKVGKWEAFRFRQSSDF